MLLIKKHIRFWLKHLKGPGGLVEILKVSVPFAVVLIAETVLVFFDRLFLSWYSPEALAAVNPASNLALSIMFLFTGVAMYVGTLAARYYGAKRYNLIGRVLWQGIYFALLSFIPLILFIPIGRWVFTIFNHGNSVVPLEQIYFTVFLAGSGTIVLIRALGAFFLGLGKTKINMLVSIFGITVNICGNYMLIFGKFGLPEMGIAGAATATVLATFLDMLLFILILNQDKFRNRFYLLKEFKFHKAEFTKLIKFGFPHSIGMFLDMFAYTIFFMFIGKMGTTQLAASNILNTLYLTAFLPMIAICGVLSILIGQYLGKNKINICLKLISNTMFLVSSYAAVMLSLFFLCSNWFITFFKGTNTSSFTEIKTVFLNILFVLVVLLISDIFQYVYGSVLSGGGDTRYKIQVMGIGIILFFFIELILVQILKVSLVTAWLCMCLYYLVIGLLFYLRYRTGHWKYIDVIQE